MDRRVDWIVRKGAFAVALYMAIVSHLAWLPYAVAAFVWWTLLVSLREVVEGRPMRPVSTDAVPHATTMAFDLAVLGSMFLAHWYWTAFAYALSCGCLAVAQARATSKP